jgi:hypothetical protein
MAGSKPELVARSDGFVGIVSERFEKHLLVGPKELIGM